MPLGTPSQYEVLITGYTADDIKGVARWTEASWERALSNPSDAEVTCPTADMILGPDDIAKTWSHGLRFERDAELVWWGPIRTWTVSPASGLVTLGATDAMGLTRRRRMKNDLVLENVNVASAFATLVSEAGDLRGLVPPEFTSTAVTTREYVAEDYEYVADAISELDLLALWSVVANELIGVGVGGVSGGRGPLVFGPFDRSSFTEIPEFIGEGDEQANEVIIPGADNGERGFRRRSKAYGDTTGTGTLSKVVTSSHFRSTTDAASWRPFYDALAEQLLRQWTDAPVVVSGGSLAPDAPVAINDLIPATFWTLDLDQGVLGLADTFQLESVQVDVSRSQDSGLNERVAVTLVPEITVGFE